MHLRERAAIGLSGTGTGLVRICLAGGIGLITPVGRNSPGTLCTLDMPRSLQSRCMCVPPPDSGSPSASTVRLPMKACPLFFGIGIEFAANPAPIGTCGMLRVGVEATARGMNPPIFTVAPIMPTAMVSAVWPISASLAESAFPVSSAVGGGGIYEATAAVMKSCGQSSVPTYG